MKQSAKDKASPFAAGEAIKLSKALVLLSNLT